MRIRWHGSPNESGGCLGGGALGVAGVGGALGAGQPSSWAGGERRHALHSLDGNTPVRSTRSKAGVGGILCNHVSDYYSHDSFHVDRALSRQRLAFGRRISRAACTRHGDPVGTAVAAKQTAGG